ncbi:EscU/YscU/HrcU family type III secretion system export apparatus switch protein, partial [bacterium]|nr:EscU/YscU/HrcU family type III secretion system export apparatus switch protein [bacterium]
EVKDSEGDADIKNMRRQMHKEIVSYGLSERVAAAQIVVVNPTTFAVALEYREATGSAPRVIAKGAFESAAEIRRLAAKFKVPVVRHPPLARQLFLLMIEEEIPLELFRAVAELLVYVIRLTESERKRYY